MIGPAESTGETMRMRSSARSIAPEMRLAIRRPRPGENHGRTVASPRSTGSVAYSPEPNTRCLFHSSSKFRV